MNDPARHNAKPENLYCLHLRFPACTRRVNGTHKGPMCRNRQRNTERLPAGPCMRPRIVSYCTVLAAVWATWRKVFFGVTCRYSQSARSLVVLLFINHARAVFSGHHNASCRWRVGRGRAWTWRKKRLFVSSTAPADLVELSVTTVGDCLSSIGSPVIGLTSLVHPGQADELVRASPRCILHRFFLGPPTSLPFSEAARKFESRISLRLRWFAHSLIHTCISH